ncbi:cytosine permease [Conyzicola sp.]|uniref:purine-cytosine permease family protein n=1 Tax=Conyzicola sp. TaxID=1969404 RepID=UPI003988C7B9
MNSTGDPRGDDVSGVDPFDSSAEDEFAPPRIRRSTYTPPPQYRDTVAPPEAPAEPVTPMVQAPPARATPVESAPVQSAPVQSAPEPISEPVAEAPREAPPTWVLPAPQTPAPEAPEIPAPPAAWTPPAVAPAPAASAPVSEPLTAAPVWSPQADLPADPPVEPTAPYRAWTPETPVDADAYWNTARPASYSPERVEPPVEPLPPAPVWSLDTGLREDAELPNTPPPPRNDPYRPWTPEPFAETTPLWNALFPDAPPTPVGTAVPAPAPEVSDVSEPQVPAPESPAPAFPEDAAAALASQAPPAGRPWVPQRRSLPDDELLSVLEATDNKPGGTLSAMDALENEMRLREIEVQEYRDWEDSMLAVGTPEALAAVAQVRPEFSAIVIPDELVPTQAIPIQYPAAPEPVQPEPVQPEPVQPEPVQPEPQVEPDDEVSHDMPQSWFDALVNPTEPEVEFEAEPEAEPDNQPDVVRDIVREPPVTTPAVGAAPVAPVAVPTGYPVPKFDALIAADSAPDAPPGSPPETGADVAPEEKRKRPFGVAVADGSPQEPAAAQVGAVAPSAGRVSVFTLEQSGERPTPRELRTGHAARLFWLWFAANSSVVSLGLGAMVFSLGMSLRQSIVATLAGVALSFIPLGLGTLAGKRSGQPTVVVSRAAFGIVGNVLPAILALVSRVFWGAVLLWLFATSVSALIGDGRSTAGLVVVFIVVGVMLAVVVAFLGYWLLARVQLVVSIVSAVLIVGFVALTWQRVDFTVALSVADGPWVLVVTGAVAVFAFLGLVWANSASDLARYQRPGASAGSSGSNMLWAGFGTTLPSFVLVAYGALLAASDGALGAELAIDPVGALTGILPGWYAVPLVVATAFALLSGVVLSTYSGAFALQGVGLRVERQWATVAVGGILAVVAVGFTLLDLRLDDVFRDAATTIAVPVAAWAGIFAADTMIRNRAFHTESLLRAGGVYPNVNRVNLPALVVITLIGWAFTSATVAGLGWQGYGFAVAGVDLDGPLAGSDLGVLVALVLGIVTPLATGIGTIRRQEAAARQLGRATPK